jgi:hypothetical protein
MLVLVLAQSMDEQSSQRTVDLEKDICDLVLNILSNVVQNKLLMGHLFAYLMQFVN